MNQYAPQLDLDTGVHPGDAQVLRGLHAEHDRGVVRRGAVEEDAGGKLPAQRGQEVGRGGQHRQAAGLDRGDLVGLEDGGADRRGLGLRLHGTDARDHAGGGQGQGGRATEELLPGRHGQEVGAQLVELGEQARPARLGDPEHGHHGGDADADADRGEEGPHAP